MMNPIKHITKHIVKIGCIIVFIRQVQWAVGRLIATASLILFTPMVLANEGMCYYVYDANGQLEATLTESPFGLEWPPIHEGVSLTQLVGTKLVIGRRAECTRRVEDTSLLSSLQKMTEDEARQFLAHDQSTEAQQLTTYVNAFDSQYTQVKTALNQPSLTQAMSLIVPLTHIKNDFKALEINGCYFRSAVILMEWMDKRIEECIALAKNERGQANQLHHQAEKKRVEFWQSIPKQCTIDRP